MKKLLLLIMFCFTITFMSAQQGGKKPSFRINVYTLYAFDDKVDSYYSNTSYFEGKIKGGFEWGGGLEYMARPEYGIELSYLRLDSDAPMTYADGVLTRNTTFEQSSNYILLGGNRYVKLANPKVEPYGGFQLGMAIIDVKNPDNGNSDSATKFAWGLKGGLNIWATPKIGIKLQAALLSAVQGTGGSLYFGTGGAGAGVSTYSTALQFSLGGGLTFNLGDN